MSSEDKACQSEVQPEVVVPIIGGRRKGTCSVDTQLLEVGDVPLARIALRERIHKGRRFGEASTDADKEGRVAGRSGRVGRRTSWSSQG